MFSQHVFRMFSQHVFRMFSQHVFRMFSHVPPPPLPTPDTTAPAPGDRTPGAGFLRGVGMKIKGPLYCTISVPGAQPQNRKNFPAEIRKHLL